MKGRECSFPHCAIVARTGDLCNKHKPKKLCEHHKCVNRSAGRGACVRHGGGYRCTEPGCLRSVLRTKKCRFHLRPHLCNEPNCVNNCTQNQKCSKHLAKYMCSEPDCRLLSSEIDAKCFLHSAYHWRCTALGCLEFTFIENMLCLDHIIEDAVSAEEQ